MSIWALADLHLSFGIPDKKMDIFGEEWINHAEKVEGHWKACIKDEDLVLLPGDISWAMRVEEAKIDLDWIDRLPGTKVMIRGNHDYWWTSLTKIEKILPPSIHLIQNNAFQWNDVSIAGARLWDTPEYNFDSYIQYIENPRSKKLTEKDENPDEARKIFQRELGRLELSLKNLNKFAGLRIVMTHYPPISADLRDSQVSALLEKNNVNICVFGHLHNVKHDRSIFGEKNGVKYCLASCDYLHCAPLKIL